MNLGSSGSSTRRGLVRYLVPGVVLLAFAVRFWFLQQLLASPFFRPIEGGNDRALYEGLARIVMGGGWWPDGVFEYMPLYPWVLGVLFRLFGPNLYAAGVVGALLDSATVLLIMRIARRAGAASWAGAIMAGAYALYPMAVIYSGMTMPNTLNTVLLAGFCAMVQSFSPETRAWRWAGAGLLAGILMLGFAGMLLVAGTCLLFWAVSLLRARRPALLFKPALFACCAALPLVPVIAHNYRAEGAWVFITAHGGFNFYMGNHDKATGYPVQIEDFRGTAGSLLHDAREKVEKELGRPVTSAEFNNYWMSTARTFMRENPLRALGLTGLKWVKFWNRAEYDDMRLRPMFRLTGTAFCYPGWSGFAFFSVLGLAGLVAVRGHGALRIIALAGIAGLVLFFITSRYRLTLVPLLAIWGALFLTGLGAAGRRLVAVIRRHSVLPPAGGSVRLGGPVRITAGLVAGCAMAFWPLPGTDFRALDHYNTAAYLLACGEAGDALVQAEKGLVIEPASASLFFIKGNALFGLERPAEAAVMYRHALSSKPGWAAAHFNLAVCLKSLGHHQAALKEARAAAAADPETARYAELAQELESLPDDSAPPH